VRDAQLVEPWRYVDLAPVADTERVEGSFLHSRAFGSDPGNVASLACQFGEGLANQGVAFTLKHFPGLGRALTSTDSQVTTVEAQASALREDYLPYRDCGASPDALVMISSATYPSLTGSNPAVLSPAIYREELPLATGGSPLTISDDLQATALAGQTATAQRAINAGLDLLLYGQNEGAAAGVYHRLVRAAQSGAISRSRLEEAYAAVQSFKGLVAGAAPPPAKVPLHIPMWAHLKPRSPKPRLPSSQSGSPQSRRREVRIRPRTSAQTRPSTSVSDSPPNQGERSSPLLTTAARRREGWRGSRRP
jgi:beta-glucosidase-like glycosyl hydrolase